MNPTERIRDTLDAMSERHVPRIIIDEQAEQILKDLAEGDFVVVHCPKGERVVLDRTGDTDQMLDIEPVLSLGTEDDHLAADDGTIVYQGPGVLYEIYEQENDR